MSSAYPSSVRSAARIIGRQVRPARARRDRTVPSDSRPRRRARRSATCSGRSRTRERRHRPAIRLAADTNVVAGRALTRRQSRDEPVRFTRATAAVIGNDGSKRPPPIGGGRAVRAAARSHAFCDPRGQRHEAKSAAFRGTSATSMSRCPRTAGSASAWNGRPAREDDSAARAPHHRRGHRLRSQEVPPVPGDVEETATRPYGSWRGSETNSTPASRILAYDA